MERAACAAVDAFASRRGRPVPTCDPVPRRGDVRRDAPWSGYDVSPPRRFRGPHSPVCPRRTGAATVARERQAWPRCQAPGRGRLAGCGGRSCATATATSPAGRHRPPPVGGTRCVGRSRRRIRTLARARRARSGGPHAQTHAAVLRNVPIVGEVISTVSPACSVKSSGGTKPVPVSSTVPAGIQLWRRR